MYGCPRPIVTAFIPVGNECSWRNEDSCYGRYQADPYIAKIKYWEGLKVPPDLEYCDGLLNRKVPFWLYHKYLLYTRLDQAYRLLIAVWVEVKRRMNQWLWNQGLLKWLMKCSMFIHIPCIPFSRYPISSWILSSCVKESNYSITSIVSNCVRS